MKRILGLDPSKSSTGWAFYAEGANRPYIGIWDKLGSEETERRQLYYKFYQTLVEHHSVYKFNAVFAEAPINHNKWFKDTRPENIWISIGMGTILELFCHTMNIPLKWAEPGKWRSAFGVRLRKDDDLGDLKKQAIARCKSFGINPRKSDDAEAFGIMHYGCAHLRVHMPWDNERLPLGGVK